MTTTPTTADPADPRAPLLRAPATARAPGVYIDLDEDEYHRDPSLGSGDVRDLWFSPTDYWWGSAFNPSRPPVDEDDDKPSLVRGRAMHQLVLRGEAAFDRDYVRGAVHAGDMSPSEKGALTKAANAKAAALGKLALPSADYDRIAITGAMITNHPHLGSALKGGLAEVAIFWREVVNGVEVPCKALIDWLKPRGCGDLKSITTWRKVEFRRACRDAIANLRYDIQAGHYLRGREVLAGLVRNGLVYGVKDDATEALVEQIAAEERYAFQFIFFQATRSPVTWSCVLSPANPVIEVARGHRREALETYASFMREVGPDKPWLLTDRPQELPAEELPAWWGRK